MAEARAEIIITAKDNASAVINSLSRNIQLAQADRIRMQELVKKSIDDLSSAAKKTGAVMLGLAAGGGALIVNATLLAARVETLGVVLETVGKNAGYSKEQIAGFEEAVKKQGITTQAARDSLILMAQANLDLSRSADLARIAQDAAVIAGINSSEAFRRMTIGINQLDPLILRNLGLVVDLGVAYKRFADEQGRSMFSITGAEKRMIALNEVVRAGIGIAGSYEAAMGTAGKQMTSLARHVEEAQLALGQAFLPTFSTVILKTTAALEVFNKLSFETKAATGEFLGFNTVLLAATGGLLIAIPKTYELAKGLKEVGTALAILRTAGGLKGALVGLAGPIGVIATVILTVIEINKILDMQLQELTARFKESGIAARTAGHTYTTYEAQAIKAAQATGAWQKTLIDLGATTHVTAANIEQAKVRLGIMSEEMFNGVRASKAYAHGLTEADFALMRLGIGAGAARLAAEALAAEIAAANTKLLLQSSLSGEIGKAFETYAEKTGTLKEKQAELTLEMEKYEAAQRKAIPATINLAEAQNAQALAAFKLEEAQARLAAAQKALSENTDPERQREMEGAVLAAQVAVDKAAGSVATWTDKLSGGTGTLADYSEKIAGLKEQFEGNEETLRNLTAAHDEHLNRIIFSIAQQALYSAMKAAGIEVTVEMQLALLEEARQLGLVDEATYLATQRMLSWTEGVIDGTDKIDHLNVRVEATKDQIETGLNPAVAAATTATYGFRDSLVDAKDAALAAAGEANALTGAINGIPRYTRIEIETYHTTFRRWVDLGGGGGGGGGGLEAAQPGDIPEGAGVVLPTAPRAAPPPAAPRPSRPPPRSYIPREERQRGGPVTAGWPYIVGEAGPEWFVPRQSGTVVPGAGGMRLRLEVPIYLDGREIGKAAYDGLVEEARARGMRLTPVA